MLGMYPTRKTHWRYSMWCLHYQLLFQIIHLFHSHAGVLPPPPFPHLSSMTDSSSRVRQSWGMGSKQ